VKWFRLAAEQGDTGGQFNLGVAYENGEGVPQDAKKAVKWYRLAAKHGHMDAQFTLGRMYANGEGVPQDAKKAVKWYQLAAEHGHVDALFTLGRMYANGEGVPRDDEEAAKWYRLAAKQDDEEALERHRIAGAAKITSSSRAQAESETKARKFLWSTLLILKALIFYLAAQQLVSGWFWLFCVLALVLIAGSFAVLMESGEEVFLPPACQGFTTALLAGYYLGATQGMGIFGAHLGVERLLIFLGSLMFDSAFWSKLLGLLAGVVVAVGVFSIVFITLVTAETFEVRRSTVMKVTTIAAALGDGFVLYLVLLGAGGVLALS
jgi:uncharacterized protein YdaT